MKALITFRRFRRRITLILRGDDIQATIDGPKWKALVWHFDQFLRSEAKYGGVDKAYDYRDELRRMASEENLNIE